MSDGRPGWLIPAAAAVLVAMLGIATNLATDLRSNWIAWAAVVLLTLGITVATVASERRRHAGREGSVMANTTMKGHSSVSQGLQMRRVRTVNRDGSTTVVEEIFSEELARQTLRDDGDDVEP
jgi:hypothetical protein